MQQSKQKPTNSNLNPHKYNCTWELYFGKINNKMKMIGERHMSTRGQQDKCSHCKIFLIFNKSEIQWNYIEAQNQRKGNIYNQNQKHLNFHNVLSQQVRLIILCINIFLSYLNSKNWLWSASITSCRNLHVEKDIPVCPFCCGVTSFVVVVGRIEEQM